MGNVIRKNTFYRQESAHLYICALCSTLSTVSFKTNMQYATIIS